MKKYIEKNRKAYDALAKEYEKRVQVYVDKVRRISNLFTNYLKENFNEKKVLELWPGSGLSLSTFEKEWFKTTWIDFSEKMLEVSRKISSNTRYILGDFLTYDFEELKYNGIYAQAFIHLFPREDVKKVLKKIFNLLEDTWVAHISTTLHNIYEEGYSTKNDYPWSVKRFRIKWTEKELLEEIEKVWFKIYQKEFITETNNDKKWVIIIARK